MTLLVYSDFHCSLLNIHCSDNFCENDDTLLRNDGAHAVIKIRRYAAQSAMRNCDDNDRGLRALLDIRRRYVCLAFLQFGSSTHDIGSLSTGAELLKFKSLGRDKRLLFLLLKDR